MARAPGTDSILFDLRGNNCSQSNRLQPAARAESQPKLTSLFNNVALDVGRLETESARYRHHRATSFMLCGVGTISNAGPFVRSSLNESFLLLLAFMISVSVPSLALSADVAVRRRHQEHVNFVMHELSHRSKNLLSIVQSMANQVARQTKSLDDFYAGFSRRLCAFAEIHDLLVKGDWHGADIRDLIRSQLAPFHNLGGSSVLIEGPELKIESEGSRANRLGRARTRDERGKTRGALQTNGCRQDSVGAGDRWRAQTAFTHHLERNWRTTC